MKRFNNLYERICSVENLKLADEKARRGKVNTPGVRIHDENREANINALYEMLKNKTYKTSPYTIFEITDPKPRKIYRLPYFPDRICHHAVMNVMEPIWCNIFTNDTYSCIKGRGIHGVVRNLRRDLRENVEETRYCLKLDIHKFYPSVDHEILKEIIRKKIKDKDLLWLLDEIIDSSDGVPIGNYLSQFFANLYLAYFDHWLKEDMGVKHYYRYADDLVILHRDKGFLQGLLIAINDYLILNLKLSLKPNYQVFPVDARGIDFVGYRFYHTHTLLRKTIKRRFCRRVAVLNRLKHITPEEYRQQICCWTGWIKYCNGRHLLNSLDMKKFSEISKQSGPLEGRKISIDDILEKEVIVNTYDVIKGKYESETCLVIQIEFEGEKRVIFTGSEILTKTLKSISPEDFPFSTTIIKQPTGKRSWFYKFT